MKRLLCTPRLQEPGHDEPLVYLPAKHNKGNSWLYQHTIYIWHFLTDHIKQNKPYTSSFVQVMLKISRRISSTPLRAIKALHSYTNYLGNKRGSATRCQSQHLAYYQLCRLRIHPYPCPNTKTDDECLWTGDSATTSGVHSTSGGPNGKAF